MAQAVVLNVPNLWQVVVDSTAGTQTFQTYDTSTSTWVTQWTLTFATGAITLAENQTVSGTLAVTGAVTLSDTLAVTGTATLSSTLAVTDAVTAGGVNPNVAVQSLAGETAGTVYYVQPFAGSGYKKVLVWFDGYENDSTANQTITFPTAFASVANVTSNTSGLTLTTSDTELTITAPDATTVYNGVAVVEGW